MKKLIVEIADKYADAASMTFIGTNCAESEEIRMTVAAVALKPDITAIAVCEDGSSIWYEGDLKTKKNQLSIEKLINAVGQLKTYVATVRALQLILKTKKITLFALMLWQLTQL